MRLIMNDNLEAELQQYYMENNRHKIAQKANLDNEIDFLLKRVELIHEDIQMAKQRHTITKC